MQLGQIGVERPTVVTIERDVRDALVRAEVACIHATHDGLPVFDAFHEDIVRRSVAELDRLWSQLVNAEWHLRKVPEQDYGPGVCCKRWTFDVGDIEAAEAECVAPLEPEQTQELAELFDDGSVCPDCHGDDECRCVPDDGGEQ